MGDKLSYDGMMWSYIGVAYKSEEGWVLIIVRGWRGGVGPS